MIFNNWVLYIAAAAYAVLLGALAILLVINADQRAAIATANAVRASLQTQNQEWAHKTAETNAALAKLNAAETANVKAITKARAVAAKSAQKFKTQAAAIAAFKAEGSDCEQATALHQAYLDQWR